MLRQLDTFLAFAVTMLGVSLLITVLLQTISALFSLRGTNLRWGIDTLLEQIDPRLSQYARTISNAVLQHPLVSDSTWSKTQSWPVVGKLLARWRLAKAIRVEELMDILRRLAKPSPAGQAPSTWEEQLAATLAQNDANAAARLASAKQAIGSLSPEVIAKIDTLAPQMVTALQKAVSDLELWFDSVMNRVSQRFVLRMRLWTVFFSVLVAFALHLDSSDLLIRLNSDPELRAALVASTGAISKDAERVFGRKIQSALSDAVSQLKTENPDAPLAETMPPVDTIQDAEKWLRSRLPDREQTERLVERYRVLAQDLIKKELGKLGEDFVKIRESLATSGLQLLPDYRIHRRKDLWPDWWILDETNNWFWRRFVLTKHFWGVLASAALLSLGAPFWFNLLKTASNLRPVVATREKQEREARS